MDNAQRRVLLSALFLVAAACVVLVVLTVVYERSVTSDRPKTSEFQVIQIRSMHAEPHWGKQMTPSGVPDGRSS